MLSKRRVVDTIAGLAGLLVLGWLVWDTGFDAIGECLARMGPALPLALLPYTIASLLARQGHGWWAGAVLAGLLALVAVFALLLVRVQQRAPAQIGARVIGRFLPRGRLAAGLSERAAAIDLRLSGFYGTERAAFLR